LRRSNPVFACGSGLLRFARNDDQTHFRIPATHFCPSSAISFAPSKARGRREDRVRAAPAVSCAMMCSKKAHTSIQVQRKHSGLPCAMALRLTPCSPRRSAFLPPSPTNCSANLTPASRRQDHTASPSASVPLVWRHPRVHRDPPHVRDVANAPLSGRDDRHKQLIWVRGQGKFLKIRNDLEMSAN
jgi:hypothetical protein